MDANRHFRTYIRKIFTVTGVMGIVAIGAVAGIAVLWLFLS
jgi:GTPase